MHHGPRRMWSIADWWRLGISSSLSSFASPSLSLSISLSLFHPPRLTRDPRFSAPSVALFATTERCSPLLSMHAAAPLASCLLPLTSHLSPLTSRLWPLASRLSVVERAKAVAVPREHAARQHTTREGAAR